MLPACEVQHILRRVAWMKWIVCTLTEMSIGEEVPSSLTQFTPSEGVLRL